MEDALKAFNDAKSKVASDVATASTSKSLLASAATALKDAIDKEVAAQPTA